LKSKFMVPCPSSVVLYLLLTTDSVDLQAVILAE
jgi:hypothetical protein